MTASANIKRTHSIGTNFSVANMGVLRNFSRVERSIAMEFNEATKFDYFS